MILWHTLFSSVKMGRTQVAPAYCSEGVAEPDDSVFSDIYGLRCHDSDSRSRKSFTS